MNHNAVDENICEKSVYEVKSSDVQLERLELASNSIASWTPWCSAASVFTDQDVNAFLA